VPVTPKNKQTKKPGGRNVPKGSASRDSNKYYTGAPVCIMVFTVARGDGSQVSISGQMDRYPHSGMFFTLKKEGDSETCYTTDGPRGCDAE
jgi:hypothetical protein